LFHPVSGRAQAYSVEYLKHEYVPLTPSIKPDLDFLKRAANGQFRIVSRTDADDKWVVNIDRVTAPGSTWLYERKGRRLTRLFVARPELEGAPLVQMWPQAIKARDGLTLVSYLTLPKGADADADGGRPAGADGAGAGGPWARQPWLQQLSPVAGESRLRGAVGQFPHLDRFRQEVHLGRRPAMGPQDA
jgi:dipeptidyl aminopeptidase/acylaminoacyl peptidase